jgi:hypothetical protein
MVRQGIDIEYDGGWFFKPEPAAKANPEKLMADFLTYGRSTGKNLKLGNEIESSYRITKIIPQIALEDQVK